MDEDVRTFRSSRHSREVLVATWQDAEELAAWHMRSVLGFDDSAVTRSGPDGGLDVVATNAAAQVKHYAGQVGAPDVQRLVGAAHAIPARLFYAQAGFTQSAITYALSAEVALFTYDVYGEVVEVNEVARRLVDQAIPVDFDGQAIDDKATIAYLGGLAASVSDAMTIVETKRDTDLPAVFVCAELGIQLAAAAAARTSANASDLGEHDRIDAEIVAAIRSGGPVQPPSWWFLQLHRWAIQRGQLTATPSRPASGWANDTLGVAGVVRRWPLSVGAELSYLKWYTWPQHDALTREVADQIVRLDPLRKGAAWCRGAMWHVNRELPWAVGLPLNIRFYDELVPDIENWRSEMGLDEPASSSLGPLWQS